MKTKLQLFLGANRFPLIFAAAVLLVGGLLVMQYRNLQQLRELDVIAEKHQMRGFADEIQSELKNFYRGSAGQILNLSEAELNQATASNSPFRRAQFDGLKNVFLAQYAECGDTHYFVYGGQSNLQVPVEAETAACALAKSYRSIVQTNDSVKTTDLQFDGRDQNNKILFKPILSRSQTVVGIVGMTLDEKYAAEVLFPTIVEKALVKFFPEHNRKNVFFRLSDERGAQLFAQNSPNLKFVEIENGVPYFYNWQMQIGNRNGNGEQLASWNFNLNFGLQFLMSLVLLVGLGLVWQTVRRQSRLTEMKSDFVSNVSHELRTPLSSIRVFGELLKGGRISNPEKIVEYGAFIETESRRLTRLVNNILDFSNSAADNRQNYFELAELAEVVSETAQSLTSGLTQENLTVDFQSSADSLPQVSINRDLVSQAIINLLDNAVKYSEGEKRVKIVVSGQADFVQVAITDNGIGITAKEQKQIFEKFYRVSTGLVHNVKGSGLGLALVQQIMRTHNGTVKVESRLGAGSTFTLRFPIERSAMRAATTAATITTLEHSPTAPLD